MDNELTYEEKVKRNKQIFQQKVKKIKFNRNICFIIMFFIFIILTITCSNYDISYDNHMYNTINDRAFNGEKGDISEAVVLFQDANIKYENRDWMLQHKELYYLQWGIILGIIMVAIDSIIFIYYNNKIEEEEIKYDDFLYY